MHRALLCAPLLTVALIACKREAPPQLAPVAQPLVEPKAATAGALRMEVVTASSSASWLMDAPVEKIFGELPEGLSGVLFVDPSDLRKTTGVIHAQLGTLLLSQQKREEPAKDFGPKVTSAEQNEHAHAWLEIGSDAPAEVRAKNARASLQITSVTTTGAADLTRLSGDRRTLHAKVDATLVLHGHQTTQTLDVAVTAHFDGDTLRELHVETLSPLMVSLEPHDVRPRDAFGKLAQDTLKALSHAVAPVAPVEVELIARP